MREELDEAPDASTSMLAKRHNKSNAFVRIYRHTSLVTNDFPRLSVEGHNERDYLLLCDFWEGIKYICTCLRSIIWSNGRRRYTPDVYYVNRHNEQVFVEVKSDQAAEEPKFIRKFQQLREEFSEAGYRLELVTRSAMPSRAHVRNLRRFYLFRTGQPPAQADVSLLHGLIGVGEKRPFFELMDELSDQKLTTHVIWYGLANRLLVTEMDKDINFDSIITRRK